MNKLLNERSAYLKHAADQKVDWHPWSEEAFEKARRENKPVFLSSGAVWCHWCHVMAQESFYDNETGALLNEHFINIKLDRDEKPHIDRRYQLAVSAMGEGGGWPLSVFLTHDKKPFFGGTYFPPEDRFGRPGFKKVIKTVTEFYRDNQNDISDYTGRLIDLIKPGPMQEGDINESQLERELQAVLSEFDPKNGGFGTAPKFPMPGALQFLISRYFISRDEAAADAIKNTLRSMAAGGFHDHLGGGFHRYSTDRAWIIPHFEKMADDNAWLLRNYLNAYSVFGDEFFKAVTADIIRFIKDVLSDPDGGFYASQDADVTADDEGGYFTWSDEDLKTVLNDKEYRLLSLHLMHEAGSMHHDRSRKVLFAVKGAREIAEETGIDIAEAIKTIKTGKEKLLHERNKRDAPFIDKTLYTSINGMLISAFFEGYRTLNDKSLKDFALISLEKIMTSSLINGRLFHTEGTPALLDDYVYLAEALITAYEVTGETSWLNRAERILETCIEKLWDSDEGGFFDTDDHLLGVKIKDIDDNPRPSGNSVAIKVMLKLHQISGKDIYHEYAEKALRAFKARAASISLHAGYYYSALDAFFNAVRIELHTAPGSELAQTALSLFSPFTALVYGEDEGHAVPCRKDVCHGPITDPLKLKEYFNKISS